MHFIEQMFGVSLDGGTGSLELLVFVVTLSAITVAYLHNRRAQRRTS
jgi:hypothetical protein